jgi:SAM-dependent methyltransferase
MHVRTEAVLRCPVCSSEDGKWLTSRNQLRIATCVGCRHAYVWPTPSQEFLDGIYQNAYYHSGESHLGFNDYASLAQARRRMFARHLNRIEAFVNRGRVLDVGCATGDFLKVARERGWEVMGADLSPARAVLSEIDIPLVGDSIQDARVEPGSLDLVTFWDVLEHMPDPVPDLRRARALLRPGGAVALTVPDAASLVARLSRQRWFGYNTAGEHLQFFTPASLKQAFEAAGLELRVRRPVTWSCTLGFLGSRAGFYLGPVGRVIARVLAIPKLSSMVLDVPQVNQFALGFSGPARA